MNIFGRIFGGIRTGARSILEGIFGRSEALHTPDIPADLPDPDAIPEPSPGILDVEEIPEELTITEVLQEAGVETKPTEDYFEGVYEQLPEEEADYYHDELEGFTDEFGQIRQEYNDMLDSLQGNGHIQAFNNDDERREFLRFLQSDFWESKKQYIYTAGTMQAIQTAIQNGAKVSDLESAYNDWMLFDDDDTDIEDIWAGWTRA